MTIQTIRSRKFLVPLAVFVALAAATIGIFSILNTSVKNQQRVTFIAQTRQITSLVQTRMTLYENLLYGLQGFFAGSQNVTSDDWNAYVSKLNLDTNYSGIAAVFYVERVPAAATSTYPYPIYPKSTKQVYLPITYSYFGTETAATSTVLGFDTSSDPNRLAALTQAGQTGLLTASGVVINAASHLQSFVIYAPIYTNGASVQTTSEKESALRGFVGIGFGLNTLFNGLANDPVFNKNINVEIYDAPTIAGASTSTLLYASDTTHEGIQLQSESPSASAQFSHITVGGRTWTLYFTPLSSYGALSSDSANPIEDFAPLGVLVAGLFLSLFISWLIYLYASARDRAVGIAERITKSLAQSQQLLKISMESAGDMIFLIGEKGEIVDVNPVTTSMLGYSKEELQHMAIFDIHPNTDINTLHDMSKTLFEKKNMTVEAVVRRKDGTTLPVESRVSLADGPKGKLMVSIMRDISERKESEKELQERTEELERANALMVDRELAMVELKKKIAKESSSAS